MPKGNYTDRIDASWARIVDTGERAHLEKAEAIFAKIGVELVLAKAKELLQR